MSATKYVDKIGDYRLINVLCLATNTDKESIVDFHIRRENEKVAVDLRTNVVLYGETEPTTLEDYFEIDDFTVTPYDYAGDGKDSIRWRKWMYQLFGAEYALDYLLKP
jgi:hypothetical protein